MEVQIYWEAKKEDGSHLCLCPWRLTSILGLPFLGFWEHHSHHANTVLKASLLYHDRLGTGRARYLTYNSYLTMPWSS